MNIREALTLEAGYPIALHQQILLERPAAALKADIVQFLCRPKLGQPSPIHCGAAPASTRSQEPPCSSRARIFTTKCASSPFRRTPTSPRLRMRETAKSDFLEGLHENFRRDIRLDFSGFGNEEIRLSRIIGRWPRFTGRRGAFPRHQSPQNKVSCFGLCSAFRRPARRLW